MIMKLLLLVSISHADFGIDVFNDELVNCPTTRSQFEQRLERIEKKLRQHVKNFTPAKWSEMLFSRKVEGQLITFFIADLAPDVDSAPIANTCIPAYKKFKKEITETNLQTWKNCVDTQFRAPLVVPNQIKTCFEAMYGQKK